MLQPKVWVIKEKKVIDVHAIDFVNKIIFQNTGGRTKKIYPFDEVEFMENTGYVDINKKHICVGDIVKILGAYFEIKYRAYKGYVIKNKKYTLSLEANLDCVSIVGNIYENKELVE
jgi:hypothetical protein